MAVEMLKNYIGGQWVEGSGEVLENRNPADTDDLICTFRQSTPEDVARAVEAAVEGFEEWRRVPAPIRGNILRRACRMIEQQKEELARIQTREMGKPLVETRGDVQEAIDTGYWMAGEGRRLYGFTTPSELRDKWNMTYRAPVGVCTLITPWNFPTAIPAWKIFPALICGNAVVFKPAEDVPLSADRLVRIFIEAGVPPGVINLVHGDGAPISDALITDPRVSLVSFTGSSEVGRIISEKCGRHLKKHSLEMGGKNVQVVMEDADLELAVDGALWGAFGTSGQRCTATSRLLLQESIQEAFMERFLARVRELKVGNGLKEEDINVGPIINRRQLERILGYLKKAREEGLEPLIGGHQLTEGDYAKGYFIEPTVFVGVTPEHTIWKEEVFGPVLSVASFSDLDEAIALANETTYGLSASIYTRDIRNAFVFLNEVETGLVYVNAPTIGAESHMPFGGMKNTGNGHREASITVLEIFTEWKAINIDYSGSFQRAQIDVVTE